MFRVSCIQLCSSDNTEHNLKRTKQLIIKAVKQKSDFILTPEVSSKISLDKKKLLQSTTTMEKDSYLNGIKYLAKKYKKWILIGSLILKKSRNKLVNRSILISPKGKINCYYDKIHMYDAILSKKEKYFESKLFQSGNKIKITKLPWGKLGLSICYDLRFPELYRNLSKRNLSFITVPSAFTKTTGQRHWLTLLKARAIENFCYIFAPNQTGKNTIKRETFGHTVIISPDGKIMALKKVGKGIIYSNIIPKIAMDLRKVIPTIK